MPRIGPMELIIVLVIVLLIFGAGKIPEIGSSLGKAIHNFRKASSEDDNEEKPKEEKASQKSGDTKP